MILSDEYKKLEVDKDFIDKMRTGDYTLFSVIQDTLKEVISDLSAVPDNEYRQLALDSLKLCIVSVAEALTEPK